MKDCSNYNYKMHFKVTFFLIFIRKLSSSFISAARFRLKCFSLSTFIGSIDLYLFYCRFAIVRVQFYRQISIISRFALFYIHLFEVAFHLRPLDPSINSLSTRLRCFCCLFCFLSPLFRHCDRLQTDTFLGHRLRVQIVA